MTKKTAGIIWLTLVALLVASWNTRYYRTPKMITADGDERIACSGILSVASEGSPPVYSIAFIDQGGAQIHVYGIHKLEIVDISPFPQTECEASVRSTQR